MLLKGGVESRLSFWCTSALEDVHCGRRWVPSVLTSGNLRVLGPFRHALSASFSPFLTAVSPLFCQFCLQPEIGPHLNSGTPWAHWGNAEVLSGTLEVVLWNLFSHLLPGTPGAKAQPSVAATSVSSFLSSLASVS